MNKDTNEPERVAPSTEKREERRPEKPRGREAEGTWANLIRVRKNAKAG